MPWCSCIRAAAQPHLVVIYVLIMVFYHAVLCGVVVALQAVLQKLRRCAEHSYLID
jgi:hypothetical protein